MTCKHTEVVLMRVVQFSQKIQEVQMVCDQLQQIINLRRQITDLQTKQFMHHQCDHTGLEQQIQTLMKERDKARMGPALAGTDEDLPEELAEMTRVA